MKRAQFRKQVDYFNDDYAYLGYKVTVETDERGGIKSAELTRDGVTLDILVRDSRHSIESMAKMVNHWAAVIWEYGI